MDRPLTRKRRAKWLTVDEAAQRLRVNPATVRKWAKRGIFWIKNIQIITQEIRIEESSLDNAKMSKCVVCGKIFESKRPTSAKFCSAKHRFAYNYMARTKALRRRRPGKF